MGKIRAGGYAGLQFRTTETEPNTNPDPNPTNLTYRTDPTKPYLALRRYTRTSAYRQTRILPFADNTQLYSNYGRPA